MQEHSRYAIFINHPFCDESGRYNHYRDWLVADPGFSIISDFPFDPNFDTSNPYDEGMYYSPKFSWEVRICNCLLFPLELFTADDYYHRVQSWFYSALSCARSYRKPILVIEHPDEQQTSVIKEYIDKVYRGEGWYTIIVKNKRDAVIAAIRQYAKPCAIEEFKGEEMENFKKLFGVK